jgi:hypothetical protein
MQHLFSRANEALHQDLSGYAESLRAIVAAMPQAKEFCNRVVREARLIQALLAFGNGPQVVEFSQIAFHLSNLWPFRDDPQVRTGFEDEIYETRARLDEVRYALRLLRASKDDAIAAELHVCFSNIEGFLQEELHLLEECQARVRPFTTNPDLTHRRLELLVAAAEARLPNTPERQLAVDTYTEAASLLQEWQGGVPLDERGVAILERCLDIINKSSTLFGVLSVTAISETVSNRTINL